MQNIVDEIRNKLAAYIDSAPNKAYPEMPLGTIESERDTSHRFIRKIPKDNYRNLNRMVPLDWV